MDDGARLEVGAAIRMGLDLALALLEDTDSSLDGMLRRLARDTTRWAMDGVPIEDVQHAVHDGVKSGLAEMRERVGDPIPDCVPVVELLDLLTSVVSRAYLDADRALRPVRRIPAGWPPTGS
ncbi:hypothetical protein IU433_02990 [Nocardia puris]|uniref:RsbT co-antagonist protein RsbRD N-terminal domain-containing protein n=1 Tax=Nocardia puris TaxID=208602 RepID=A0A366DVP0_9NOCA|nr:hypothetical protein [Nocardia puris]MBF6210082.1 hypothetical protein [Nocardia puris]MBF6368273.1 hypothetical protein [Nocardia puris]MBF6458008.1 hypothetical protein [Nocardia puris]RBO94170.1 hypothetical protein DFR74_102592 [Nocardia puris]